jgi:hypothetical protein
MNVSAEKIVEEPDVEITTDTAVVGNAPALRAAAPPRAPEPPPPVAPEPTPPPVVQAVAPESGETGTSPLLWLGLIG